MEAYFCSPLRPFLGTGFDFVPRSPIERGPDAGNANNGRDSASANHTTFFFFVSGVGAGAPRPRHAPEPLRFALTNKLTRRAKHRHSGIIEMSWSSPRGMIRSGFFHVAAELQRRDQIAFQV